jgi:hypothetical protein
MFEGAVIIAEINRLGYRTRMAPERQLVRNSTI